MNDYPHIINNNKGEELTFVGHVNRDGVDYLQVEGSVSPGCGPPLHVHHQQHESLTVIEGTMGIQIAGEEPRYFKPGDTYCFEPGVVHRFWNAGDTQLKTKGEAWPALNLEYFLTQIYRSVAANKEDRPQAFDGAYLLSRYKTEFDMSEIPKPVKKLIFPIVLFIGKLQGKHKKFSDAPPPI